jgi:hypothetical protein
VKRGIQYENRGRWSAVLREPPVLALYEKAHCMSTSGLYSWKYFAYHAASTPTQPAVGLRVHAADFASPTTTYSGSAGPSVVIDPRKRRGRRATGEVKAKGPRRTRWLRALGRWRDGGVWGVGSLARPRPKHKLCTYILLVHLHTAHYAVTIPSRNKLSLQSALVIPAITLRGYSLSWGCSA